MGEEIERKFKVEDESWRDHVGKSSMIMQGYITDGDSDSGAAVRLRLKDNKGYLTVKENGNTQLVRAEFEYEIPEGDAVQMLRDFCSEVITKVRNYVEVGGHTWEIDEFFGDNEGLITAEIELDDPDEDFEVPEWAGEEVTEQKKYSNFQLALRPYKGWE
jgi:CYTH domain-containing protein